MVRMLVVGVLLGLFASPAWGQGTDATALKQQGDRHLSSGDIPRAEAAYDAAIKADPTFEKGYTALSTLYLRQKKYAAAGKLLRGAVRVNPRFADGWYNLAYALRKSGSLRSSIKAYEVYTRLEPTRADPYFGVGLAWRSLGDKARAMAAFRRYAELEDRPERSAWVSRAKGFIAELERGGGAPVQTGQVDGAGERARALKQEGDRLAAGGRVSGAEAKYRAAIKKDPTYHATYTALGTLLFQGKRFSEAVTLLRAAVKRNASYHRGWFNLGYALRRAGQHGEAVEAYARYVTADPQNPDPHFGLGLAYKDLGQKSKAIQAFRKYVALEKRPNYRRWARRAEQEIVGLSAGRGAVAAASVKKQPRVATRRSTAGSSTADLVGAVADRPVPLPPPSGPGRETFAAADDLTASGRCSEAIKAYRAAIKSDPFALAAYDGLAHCAYKVRAFGEGSAALRIALRDNPDYVRGWLHKARLEYAGKDHVRAVGSYRKYLGTPGADPSARLELARSLRNAGMKPAAAMEYKTYLLGEKRRDRIPYLLAAHLEMKAMGSEPPPVRVQLGKRRKKGVLVEDYIQRKRDLAALSGGQDTMDAKPAPVVAAVKPPPIQPPPVEPPPPARVETDPTVELQPIGGVRSMLSASTSAAANLTQQADNEVTRRHYALALQLYQAALAIDPGEAVATEKAARLATRLGLGKQALTLWRRLVDLRPDSPTAKKRLADARAAAARNKKANTRRLAAVRQARGDLRRKRFARADERLKPHCRTLATVELYVLRGRAALGRGDVSAALSHGGRALVLLPTSPEALWLMGDVEAKRGQKATAMAYYGRYLRHTAGDQSRAADRTKVSALARSLGNK